MKLYRPSLKALSLAGKCIVKNLKLEDFENATVIDCIENIYLKYYADVEKAHAICAHDWTELRDLLAVKFMKKHKIYVDYKRVIIFDYISKAKKFNTLELLEELKQY